MLNIGDIILMCVTYFNSNSYVISLPETRPEYINAIKKYVVYKTNYEGGRTGHGPNDVYPDGYRVFCEQLDDTDNRIDFFQTGCFTHTFPDIKPIGRAKRHWEITELY